MKIIGVNCGKLYRKLAIIYWVSYQAIQIILKEETPTLMLLYVSKRKFENSYKDIPDEQFDEVVKYIEFLKQNPS